VCLPECNVHLFERVLQSSGGASRGLETTPTHKRQAKKRKNCRKTGNLIVHKNLFLSQFRLIFGRSGGVRGVRGDHTKTFRRTLAGFGLTGRQKVNSSTFDCKLELQCARNGNQNPPYCPGSLQDTFIIYS
jgi:hypothetical protein